MERKCILYLLNHKTLTDFELPILITQGYSVLLPKVYNSLSSIHSINGVSTYYYDNFLFIDTNDLAVLNGVDWFSDKILPNHVLYLVNKYFSYIFLTLLTKDPLMSQLVNNFNGTIYYRLFGREKDLTYQPLVHKSKNIKYILSYSEIVSHEPFFNSNNSMVVPLGLSNTLVTKIQNTYTGKNNRIAFICSRISVSCPYYYSIYQEFVRYFGDLDYLLLGRNNEVKSTTLSDTDYYREIADSKVMYYHGKEPRHLHYHPLEAIFIGIPVIYHKESLLGKYLSESPGRCDNIIEARRKIESILSDDKQLITDIINAQNKVKGTLTQAHYAGKLFNL